MYRFDWESQTLGAAHAMDIAVFGNGVPFGFLAGFRSADQVGEQMRKAWVQFAATGDPGWAEYESSKRYTMSLHDELRLMEDPFKGQREVMGKVLEMHWTDNRL